MAGYTTASPSFGTFQSLYRTPYRPPRPPTAPNVGAGSALAYAAAGKVASPSDPFGLAAPDSVAGNARYGGQFAAPAAAPAGSRLAPPDSVVGNSGQGGQFAPPGSVAGNSGNAPPVPAAASQHYDINGDPNYQAVESFTNMSDIGAQAAALRAKHDALLGYGDPELARSVLGDETLASAASQNPTSTLAQLGQQRSRNVTDMTEGLNKANLLFSGYRIQQEKQAGEDYQNALASAASAVNGNLGSIDAQLGAALGSNQQQRIAAMQAAYDRASQAAVANGVDPGATSPTVTGLAGVGDGSTPPGLQPPPDAGGNKSAEIDPLTGQPYGRRNGPRPTFLV